MPRNQRPLRYIRAYQLSDELRTRKYYYESFKGGEAPISWVTGATNSHPVMPLATGGASDGELDQGVTMNSITPAGMFWQTFATTAQTKNPLIPASGTGLLVSGDEVDNETLEIVPGGVSDYSRLAFKVGTDPDFFFRAKFKIADVSGSDQFGIGFRKREAFAVPTSFLTTGDGVYTDYALFGFAATAANPNPLNLSYDLNNSGSATVKAPSFTWADGKVHRLEMRVIGRKVYLRINGYRLGASIDKDADGGAITAQQTVTTPDGAFTFDSGDYVVPFIFVRHDATTPGDIHLVDLEVGHLAEIGEDPSQE